MSDQRRVYLDNAATSWPKPTCVYDAVDHYQRSSGAPAGRGAYREASEVDRQIQQARLGIAQLLGSNQANQLIFTFNGTDSLNLAIHGVLRPGDHVVTTVCEHNSVLRPLAWQRRHRGVDVTYVTCDERGIIAADAVLEAVRPETRLVAVVHASNVTGAMLPVATIGAALRDQSQLLLVDAAQTLGHLPLNVEELGADLLAASGHKGLLGPLGTGVLYIRPGVEQVLETVRQGGTGSQSDQDVPPEALPWKYESGNHNVAGLVGLAAAVEELHRRGVAEIARHERELTERLLAGLADIAGVSVLGPGAGEERAAVVSVAVDEYDPQEVAAMLDATGRIQVRAGLHCAPRMHEALGTLAGGGTVRLSPGMMNTTQDVDRALEALRAAVAADDC